MGERGPNLEELDEKWSKGCGATGSKGGKCPGWRDGGQGDKFRLQAEAVCPNFIPFCPVCSYFFLMPFALTVLRLLVNF